jgi:multicomponent Na+:H+ antiporter subunit G
MPFTEILGTIGIIIGVFFSVVGVIGMMRMPDVYSRIHSTGKIAILGMLGLLVGYSFFVPENTLKAVMLSMFMVIASPVVSHAIAAAAFRQVDNNGDDDDSFPAMGELDDDYEAN